MIKTICLLGSTGSIGRNCLDVCKALSIYPKYMACGSNIKLFAEQILAFQPIKVAVASEKLAENLREILEEKTSQIPDILYGEEGRCELAGLSYDLHFAAMSGFAGLTAVLKALETGHNLALANKESLVAAGKILMKLAHEKNCKIFPVDSEHSAIWQCLEGVPRENVRRLWLTASGGPFRRFTLDMMKEVTAADALRHPVWNMGAKISIDSATMMNKGLELIEAMHLFSRKEEEVEIIVHPEGAIHSLVELEDGALIAQMGSADMRLPIQLALTYPERVDGGWPRFDFLSYKNGLNFEAPDEVRFPSLRLAREAARHGDGLALVMNAANEVAVEAFLEGEITFLSIAELTEKCMDYFLSQEQLTLANANDIIQLDHEVRQYCKKIFCS